METLYRAKGGCAEDFNLEALRLEPADLDRLERDIASERVKPDTRDAAYAKRLTLEDREFIAAARVAIAEGKVVYFVSWW